MGASNQAKTEPPTVVSIYVIILNIWRTFWNKPLCLEQRSSNVFKMNMDLHPLFKYDNKSTKVFDNCSVTYLNKRCYRVSLNGTVVKKAESARVAAWLHSKMVYG